MKDRIIAEFEEALEIALDLLTTEQWEEYQRQRRKKFMERMNAEKKAA